MFHIGGGLVKGFLQVLSGHRISVNSSALADIWLTQQSRQNWCEQLEIE